MTRRIIFDIEGNGFLETVTKLHCICTVDIDTGERKTFGPTEIEAALEYLRTGDVLIAHNGLRYDFPVLEKLHGFVVPFANKQDTLVIGRTIRPNLKETDSRANATLLKQGKPGMGELFGKHSIEAWAFRFGTVKVGADITDYSEWTQEIQDRCESDISINLRLWQYLKPEKYSQQALELEHRVAVVCEKITQAGWPFDVKAAGELHALLTDAKHKIEVKLHEQFGGWWENCGEFTPKRDNRTRGYVAGQPCTKIEWTEFNPNSRQHIERCLRKLGWRPTEFTESGQAKLDEEVIEGVSALYPQAMGLVEYLTIQKRLGQLADGKQAWLKLVKDDGKIHAEMNPMGAVTSRMSHFNPNIAQVPATKSLYGHESRSLFTVLPGWDLVGADQEGLELRGLAHYMAPFDGGEFGRLLLEDDPHWMNVIAMGILEEQTRIKDESHPLYNLHNIAREDGAKRCIYAMGYGAGDEKTGRIILDCCRLIKATNPEWGYVYEKFFGNDPAPDTKLLRSVGKQIKNAILSKIPALKKFKDQVEDILAVQSWIPGLDKRRLPVRSPHAAVNTAVQSAGAIICKRWQADAYDALNADGLKWGWDGEVVMVGLIHDEVQVACREGLGDRVGEILVRTARSAGEPYGFRIRLDSKYKIGKTWASTH